MLKLIDLLRIANIQLRNYKIHLATSTAKQDPTPMDAFLMGEFQQWQEGQENHNFHCDEILSLIQMSRDRWLFAGVYKVLRWQKTGHDHPPYLYDTELLLNQEDFIGRVIVRYKRNYRASYVLGVKYGDQLLVDEIRPIPISIRSFPGFNNTVISHRILKMIIEHQEPSWKSALSNVQGIYLITDTQTGKIYVGSAYGRGGIWARWEKYIQSGHGDNEKLTELIKGNGIDYAFNFQYTIVETADSRAAQDYILSREGFWKDALLSREHGLNSN